MASDPLEDFLNSKSAVDPLEQFLNGGIQPAQPSVPQSENAARFSAMLHGTQPGLGQMAESAVAGASTLPFLDRLLAAIGTTGAGEGGGQPAVAPGQQYDANLAAIRSWQQQQQAADPEGFRGGTVLAPVPGLGAIARGVSGAAEALGPVASRLLGGAAAGGAAGAVQGLSSVPDLSNIPEVVNQTATGAVKGMAFGTAFGMPAAAAAYKTVAGLPGQIALGERATAVEDKLAAAVAAARAPGPERALPYFGLEGAQGTKIIGGGPGEAFAEGARLWNEPLPGRPGATYSDLAKLPIRDGRAAATAIRESLGERLGGLRDELQKAAKGAAAIDGQALKRSLGDLLGPNPSEGEQAAVKELQGIVQRAGPGSGGKLVDQRGQPIAESAPFSLEPAQLRGVIRSVEEAMVSYSGGNDAVSRLMQRARGALVGVEQQLFERYLPDRAAEAQQVRGQYRDARIVEAGKRIQEQRLNAGADETTAIRGLPKPAVDPALATERSAVEAAAAKTPAMNPLLKALGPALGAKLGYASGGGFVAGYAGLEAGRVASRAIANRFFKTVSPDIHEIAALSPIAQATLARWQSVLDAASKAGRSTAQAVHRTLIAKDPRYQELYQEISQ